MPSTGLGFDEVWLAEDYFFYGGLSSAAVVLAATERVRVGLGILSCVARHPAVTAMEISSLDRSFPGRLMQGIGHGVQVSAKLASCEEAHVPRHVDTIPYVAHRDSPLGRSAPGGRARQLARQGQSGLGVGRRRMNPSRMPISSVACAESASLAATPCSAPEVVCQT